VVQLGAQEVLFEARGSAADIELQGVGGRPVGSLSERAVEIVQLRGIEQRGE
jgi:hypothetical protein